MELIVTVLNTEIVRAKRDAGAEMGGKLLYDPLILDTINVFRDWLSEGKIQKRQEIEVLGTYLYRILFGEPVGSFFQETLRDAQKNNETLRLKLQFQNDAKELVGLPWEYLYFPGSEVSDGYFLSTEVDLVLSRWMPLDKVEGEEAQEERLRVLLVVSEPKFDSEGQKMSPVAAQGIILNMQKLSDKHNFQFDYMELPTVERLKAEITDKKPHVLHFIGHGRSDQYEHGKGQVALIDEDRTTVFWCPEKMFADYLGKKDVRLVFLHLCAKPEIGSDKFHASFAGLAPQLILANIHAVVATQFPISNPDAETFIREFYSQLAKGEPIDFAVQEGRRRISSLSSRVFGTPVLFMHRQDSVIKPIVEKEGLGAGGQLTGSAGGPTKGMDGRPGPEVAIGAKPKTALDVVNAGLMRADAEKLSPDQREPMNPILEELLSHVEMSQDEMRGILNKALLKASPEIRPVITTMIQEANNIQAAEA